MGKKGELKLLYWEYYLEHGRYPTNAELEQMWQEVNSGSMSAAPGTTTNAEQSTQMGDKQHE
jgi:hypothetical protein